MFQRTYDPASEAEFAWMVSSLKDPSLYDMSRTVFLQVFFSRFSAAEAQRVIDFLHSQLPRVKIAGMSLYGDPLVDLNTNKFIRLNICQFDESDVQIFEYDAAENSEKEIAADFRAHLAQIPEAKGVLVLGSGLTFKISRFMEDATAGFEEIPFFGAVSNINTADTESVSPYTFGRKVISEGVVLAVFSGANLHFYTEYQFGWKPIGKPLSVETGEACTIGDTLVTKIDGKPATDIYKRYLDVEPDRHFISNICEFPLAVERGGFTIARIPCGFNAKGEINMMGDIKNGETVRFTYGKTDDILKESWNASARLAAFHPQAMFMYVCANRAIFMKDKAWYEIEDNKKIAPNLCYCHGFSELYRYQGKGGVFNSTLILAGLREGDRPDEPEGLQTIIPEGLVSFDVEKSVIPLNSFEPASANEAANTARELWLNGEPAPQKKPHLRSSDGAYYVMDEGGEGDNGMDSLSNAVAEGTKTAMTHSLFERPIGKSIPLADRLVRFLEATTADLKEATQKANAASDAKSAFLSSMSHEIRTPINAVLGLDEMILRESNEAEIKSYARDIQSSGKSLLSIINDILDFSKIEAGKMEIINADYDLRQTITDLANMLETRAKNKGLDFIVRVDETMPHLLYGDETRIKQCALNILTNAVKYTREGSVTLTISGEKCDERHINLKISVRDTGIGIKEEDLPKLFKPFERIEEKRNRSIEGTGLGMSIVNGLLSQMGTRLEVKSAYGKGSDFSFTMKQEVRSWEKIGTREEARAALQKEAHGYTESFQAPNAHILVVDDTPINLTVFCGLLKQTMIQIDTATSAEEGLKKASGREYNIIFIDHLMPKMDGLEMLKLLRTTEGKNKSTICVALTANAFSNAREFYMTAGFENYISKPIDPSKLEEMICFYLPEDLLVEVKGNKEEVKSNEIKDEGDREPFATAKNLARQDFRRVSVKAMPEPHPRNAPDPLFKEFFALDSTSALKNCGSAETFRQAVKNFREDIEEKANLIEEYSKNQDWKNYTILVHALKSSARLIGATELSELARLLEAKGDEAQKDEKSAITEILEKTPELLAQYRAYYAKLAPLCGIVALAATEIAQKKEISPEKLTDALSALKEAATAFDFDTADFIVAELDNYTIPSEFSDKVAKIKRAVRNVDASAILSCL